MDIETAIDDLVSWEGYITWMYLDTAGHVTIGIGHMIPDVSSAMLLPFIHGNDEHAAATGAEISVAYEVVRAWPAAHVAGYYAAASELRLPPWQVRSLAWDRLLHEFLPGLRGFFPGFDVRPLNARRALVDMAWNLGLGGLARFHRLRKAVEDGDYHEAAAECHRSSCRDERNAWTRELFLRAARESAPTGKHRIV